MTTAKSDQNFIFFICLLRPLHILGKCIYFQYIFFFPGIDEPEVNPLFDLRQDVQRLSYGANLATSVLFVQQDAAINRQNEDRFILSGLAFAGRAPVGFSAQKAEGIRIMSDLIAGWYPVSSRPSIAWSFVSRRAFLMVQ